MRAHVVEVDMRSAFHRVFMRFKKVRDVLNEVRDVFRLLLSKAEIDNRLNSRRPMSTVEQRSLHWARTPER